MPSPSIQTMLVLELCAGFAAVLVTAGLFALLGGLVARYVVAWVRGWRHGH